MWTKDANLPGTYKTWQKTLDYVKGMNAGTYSNFGYTDWRLPNRKELQSLIDRSRYNPALPSGHPFTNVQSNNYWSSTSYVYNPSHAWIVDMYVGYLANDNKSNNFDGYVWPVRSGQVSPLVHSIIGRVTENSVGLNGVTMTLSGAASASTTTAVDGTYSFADLTGGNYTITPTLSGYTFNPSSISVTISGADVTDHNFSATPINNAPLLNPIGTMSVDEGSLLSFIISAFDSDGDILTYSATGLPVGATFNASTKTFNWTPDYNQSGTYNITFSVSDGSLSDGKIVAITVNNVNQAPALDNIGVKSVNEGTNLNFVISGNDFDGDTLTFSATDLPEGATFDPVTHTFSWTPSNTQAGKYNMIFTASDGSLTDSETVEVTVLDNPDLNQNNGDGNSSTKKSGEGSGKGGCFIATAAYGSYLDPHVLLLREFRDRILLKTDWGSHFVTFYYTYSPPIAKFITRHGVLKGAVRIGLLPIIGIAWIAVSIQFYQQAVLVLLLLAIVILIYKRRWFKRYFSIG